MKKIELIAAAITAIGILMMLLLMPGGSMILGISMTALAILYYPIGFFYFNSIPMREIFKKESYKGITLVRGLGAFGGGMIFSILAIGSLFKLLQLPGSGLMLTVGLTAGVFYLIIILIKYFSQGGSRFLKNMIVRSTIVIALSGVLMATPGTTLVKVFFRDNPEYIKAYEKAAKNPENRQLQLKAEEARQKDND
ncbi:hypothetical protein [Ekhidna sp.]|uniref:hypothetical protein n=1 Tax=Ekhidna sp. TaxID=2608089 RepID=UPI003CCBF9C1